jgi:hypothetical protein
MAAEISENHEPVPSHRRVAVTHCAQRFVPSHQLARATRPSRVHITTRPSPCTTTRSNGSIAGQIRERWSMLARVSRR